MLPYERLAYQVVCRRSTHRPRRGQAFQSRRGQTPPIVLTQGYHAKSFCAGMTDVANFEVPAQRTNIVI